LRAGGSGGGGKNPDPPARNAAFTADAAQAVTAGSAVAQSDPVFGSVHQSGGTLAAVTDVTVTPQAGGTFDFVITREGGTTTSLNSRRQALVVVPVDSPTGRRAESGLLLASDAARITAAAGTADWDPNDFGDWLVGGYWLHITGDLLVGTVTGAEIGAFIEGPELTDNSVPTSGTASYNGRAAGFFAARYGTDATEAEGTVELGDYTGRFQATATFGTGTTGTVSGTIDRIRVAGIGETPDGRVYVISPRDAGVRVELESAPIDATDGQLTGTVRLVSLDPSLPFTGQQGSWGSRLSSIDDSNSNPRALAGTHAGRATTDGGSAVVFIGAHFGTTGDFE